MEESEPTSFSDLFRIPSLRKRCIVHRLSRAVRCTENRNPGRQQLRPVSPWLSRLRNGAAAGHSRRLDRRLSVRESVQRAGWSCKILIWGFAGCIVALIGECIAVLQFQKTGDNGTAGAAVFFLFLHILCFSSTTDAASYMYASEIFPTPLRAKGLAVSVSGLFVATVIFLQAAPTAFAAISYNYFIVFIVVTFVIALVVYFYLPEVSL